MCALNKLLCSFDLEKWITMSNNYLRGKCPSSFQLLCARLFGRNSHRYLTNLRPLFSALQITSNKAINLFKIEVFYCFFLQDIECSFFLREALWSALKVAQTSSWFCRCSASRHHGSPFLPCRCLIITLCQPRSPASVEDPIRDPTSVCKPKTMIRYM